VKLNAPTLSDFEPLTALIERGIEDALKSIRATYPDDHFYAFVLSTYGDRSSVSLHANSYENLERVYAASEIETDPAKLEARFAELRGIFGRGAKKYAKMKQAKAQELAYYKWGWMEWLDYEFIAEQTVLEQTWTWLDECRKRFSPDGESFSDDYFDVAWKCVPECMLIAMENCDKKGLFGTGEARETCLLYTGEYDGGEEDDMLASVKRLNPPSIVEKYEMEMRQFLGLDE